MLEAYVDGACELVSPGGTASYGILVLRDGKDIHSDYGIIGSGKEMSNNLAEYAALLKLFDWLDKQPVEDVVVYSDSQLLVNQMSYRWEIRKGLYKPYAFDCISRMVKNADTWGARIKFEWIPREENLADKLTVKALNEVGIVRRNK